MKALRSCATDQWFTPTEVLERVHKLFGTIDLDPASSHEANERVGAERIYDVKADGLTQEWTARNVFLNPPSGRIESVRSLPVAFWQKLMASRSQIGHAIYLAFSVQQLQTLQGRNCPSPFDFTFCVPKKRLQFHSLSRGTGGAPHGNAIVYVPSQLDKTNEFKELFTSLGACK